MRRSRRYHAANKKILWQPDQAFVLTSGTMAVGSDFRRFKTQAGLEKGHRVMESVSPSPFDYRNNCLLYLPQIRPAREWRIRMCTLMS